MSDIFPEEMITLESAGFGLPSVILCDTTIGDCQHFEVYSVISVAVSSLGNAETKEHPRLVFVECDHLKKKAKCDNIICTVCISAVSHSKGLCTKSVYIFFKSILNCDCFNCHFLCRAVETCAN